MGFFDNDPKFQRLQELRDSGYKGGVDQDGNKAENVDRWIEDRRGGKGK